MFKNFRKSIKKSLLSLALITGAILVSVQPLQAQDITPLHPSQNGTDNIETIQIDPAKIYQPQRRILPKEPVYGVYARLRKFTLNTPPQTQALNDPLGVGINFLKTNQNPDGSWTKDGRSAFPETSAVGQLFKNTEETPSVEYQKAIDWFTLSFPESSDYLAEKIINLYQAGVDGSPLPDYLASQINEQDHGFGFQKFYQSDVLTTAKVLQAITQSNYQDPGADPTYTLKSVLIYLLNKQNLDGSWSAFAGAGAGASTILATNLVLQALQPYQDYILAGPSGDIVIAQKIALGLTYLRNSQLSNGIWQSDLLSTALSYDTLLNYQIEPLYNQACLDYLLQSQAEDGSFAGQNFYKTAKSLEALAKPDMAVLDIQNISGLIPNEPTVAKVVVKNLGYLKSKPLNLNKQPSAFILNIDGNDVELDFSGYEETIVFGPQSVAEITIIIRGLSFGEHNIGFRAEYADIEFRKGNNQLFKNLVFDDPGFSGPTPPAWAGASTGESAGLVKVRWHLSTDPSAAYYAVFASLQSGAYDPYNPIYISPNNQTIDVNFSFIPDYYGLPIYFTVASLDSGYVRGDYSVETWARPYDAPADYAGIVSGQVIDNNSNPVPNARIDLYTIGYVDADSQGNYSLFYYPGFYWATASRSSYISQSKEIEIKAQDSQSYNFNLEIIDDGQTPAPIAGISAYPDNREILLSWPQFQDVSGDFKHFNIYRSIQPITNVQSLEPINESITDPNVMLFIDNSIVNGLNYYYAIVAEDLSGNFNPMVDDAGPVRGNSAPQLSNLTARQDKNIVNITYDLADAENTTVNISFQYWNGANWQEIQSSTGEGQQAIGASRTGSWNVKADFPGFTGQTKIKIVANDGEAVNNTSELESAWFNIDTQAPSQPTIDFEPITADFSQLISGVKEANSSIYLNGQEITPLNEQTNWSYQVVLSEGNNNFTLTSRDAFSNESQPVEITITLDTIAPVATAPVNIVKNESPLGLKISWPAITLDKQGNPETISYYEIHRGEQANFIVNGEQTKIGQTANLEFIDAVPGIIGDVNKQYYYAIVAVDQAGNRTEQTERVGEYDYFLNKQESGTGVNLVGLPLATGITKASELWALVPNIDGLAYWSGQDQAYIPYVPDIPVTDFSVQTGYAYYIGVNQDTVWTVVGKVLSSIGPFTLIKVQNGTGVNTITLPLQRTDITKASELWTQIPNIDGLAYWSGQDQAYIPYVPGIPVTDFAVVPGGAYYVGVNQTTIWQP